MKPRRSISALALLLASAPGPTRADAALDERARVRLIDVTADVLADGQSQAGLFYAYYARGVGSRLQLSTHALADLFTVVNFNVKVKLLHRPNLRVTAEAGLWWVPLTSTLELVGVRLHLFALPGEARATVPLSDSVDLSLAAGYRMLAAAYGDRTQSGTLFHAGLDLVRYDRLGAWALTAKLPLFDTNSFTGHDMLGVKDVSGSLTLDDVPAWSILLSRDLAVGPLMHLRLGAGYRNRPGMLLLESLGPVLLNADLYWRWGGDRRRAATPARASPATLRPL